MAPVAARRGVPPNAAAARGVVGTAVPRPPVDYRYVYVSHPFYGPWGYWYPWYGSGFGWYSGYIGYNPYWYAATYWGFGRYGFWYDPFSYGYGPDLGYSGGGGSGESRSERATGSIRLKVNPGSAKVYIDGALHGTADDFNGFSDHLELPSGRQTIELRAEGYETKRVDIDVSAGRTLTERITLKKLK
jgi:hypothetical protein